MFKRIAMAIITIAIAPLACAQAWPARPIKFVMSAPAVSSIDVLGRALTDKLKDSLRPPGIIDNKPAAAGTYATADAAQ